MRLKSVRTQVLTGYQDLDEAFTVLPSDFGFRALWTAKAFDKVVDPA